MRFFRLNCLSYIFRLSLSPNSSLTAPFFRACSLAEFCLRTSHGKTFPLSIDYLLNFMNWYSGVLSLGSSFYFSFFSGEVSCGFFGLFRFGKCGRGSFLMMTKASRVAHFSEMDLYRIWFFMFKS